MAPVGMTGIWPLVGRDEELGVIAAVLSGAEEFHGVVIAGPPGVGKSRLAHDAVNAASASGNWAVRWVVGTATARAIPLGAFSQWTNGLDGNPLALVRQVITALTAAVGDNPLLLAVDDVHLLDDLSAFVLHQLVVQGAARVVATLRSGEAAPDTVSSLWKERHLQRLELQALSHPETVDLLTAVLQAPVDSAVGQRMWELSRGNALFLRQLVDQELAADRLTQTDGTWCWSGTVEVSPTLMELVQLQIGAIGEDVGEVIDLVVVGEPVNREVLTALVDPVALEEAERRGLISVSAAEGGDTVRVGHPLYGEVRLARGSRLRMRRLRGRLATALAQSDGRFPVDLVRLGLLWLDSDLPPDPEVLLAGAQAAFLRIDLDNVGRLARAAVQAGAGVPAQLLYAHALILLIRSEEAESVLASIDVGALPEPMRAIYFTVRGANLLWPLADSRAASRLVDTELAHADSGLRPTLLTVQAGQLVMAARPSEAAEALKSVDLEGLEGLPAAYHCWAAAMAFGDLGRVDEARAAAAAGYDLGRHSPEAAYQAMGLTDFHITALLLGGEVTEAVLAANDMWSRCSDVMAIPLAVATAIVGHANLGAGDLTTAIDQLSSAINDFEQLGDTSGLIFRHSVLLIPALARAGRVEGARAALEKMEQSQHPSFVWLESEALLTRAWIAAAAGRTPEARHIAACAATLARDHGQWAREVVCLQSAVSFGDSTVATRLDELGGVVEGPRAPLAARYAHALATGDGDALAAISTDYESIGDRLTALDAAAHAAAAFTEADRRGRALLAGARVDRLAAQCGATVLPSLRTVQPPVQLSGREREIFTLAARGLTDKAIASALIMSVRTIEGHVYRACTRLGLTRAEVITLVTGLDSAGD